VAELGENAASPGETESSTNNDEGSVAGIKMRTCLRRSKPTSSSFVEQGTSQRILCLQKRSEFQSNEPEDKEANEKAHEARSWSEHIDENRGSGTGIQIRTRTRSSPAFSHIVQQGTAHRRIKLQVEPLRIKSKERDSSEATITKEDRSCSPVFAETDLSTVASHEEIFCVAELGEKVASPGETESSTNNDEVSVTGIKIRACLQRPKPTPSSFVEQGTAQRRLRLQKRFELQSNEPEDKEANEKVREARSWSEHIDEKILDDKSDGKSSAGKVDGGCHQKLSSHEGWKSARYMIKVVVVVILFMAFIGLWKARNFILLPS